jgi:hypothetical protein
MIADQILVGQLPRDKKARIKNWFRLEGGAIPGKDFLALIQQAGFIDSELVGETGFNGSPVTKGVLLRAPLAREDEMVPRTEETL